MDTLANAFSKITNAQKRRHNIVKVSYSLKIQNILNVLYEEGYITGFYTKDNKEFFVGLKYIASEPTIRSIKRISRPGKRVYTKHLDIKPMSSGLGICLLFTSMGVKTDLQAKNLGLGGEIIALIK